jgi:hypothetical protein
VWTEFIFTVTDLRIKKWVGSLANQGTIGLASQERHCSKELAS